MEKMKTVGNVHLIKKNPMIMDIMVDLIVYGDKNTILIIFKSF